MFSYKNINGPGQMNFKKKKNLNRGETITLTFFEFKEQILNQMSAKCRRISAAP